MSLPLRKPLFWIHLVVGIVAGLVVAIMSITGVAIAFESQVLSWAESEARTVAAPPGEVKRLPVEELLAKVRAAKPDAQVSGVTVYPAPTSAVLVSLGRTSGVYVNPYTGEVREGGAQGWRDFFHFMEEWHRWLATAGDNRPTGKLITGVSNVSFLFLALSGLYLWFPRKWSLKQLRPIVWFRRGLKGKARDFNWHNVIGLWSVPVLVVVTASAMVISFKWASDFTYTVTGNTPPAQQGPGGSAGVKVDAPSSETRRLPLEPLFATAQQAMPAWESITYRLPSPPRGAGPKPEGQQGEANGPRGQQGERDGKKDAAPQADSSAQGRDAGKVDAVTLSVRERDGWPYFASTQLSMNPFSGELAKREGYADFNSGRKLRTWLRFLHTGEALGWPGQLIAAIASLGGVFLVWTGLALAWRRFFPRRQARTTASEQEGPEPVA
ncbi:PepSY domain-containing protein [Myxococcus sp. K15C18031901]|uniref:PepSY-associated TM helix domain-containing protein n=1 Tax=Myxococcus dinghuensis TaxID=2906761 RepID=UPI0020A78665|nr:PepSY-associated TM helix domain-containing protein [Myxococcus dinghuensis]MCP3103643.1 PepSY domain-containing protein [Myxococcus dinghuensis]